MLMKPKNLMNHLYTEISVIKLNINTILPFLITSMINEEMNFQN